MWWSGSTALDTFSIVKESTGREAGDRNAKHGDWREEHIQTWKQSDATGKNVMNRQAWTTQPQSGINPNSLVVRAKPTMDVRLGSPSICWWKSWLDFWIYVCGWRFVCDSLGRRLVPIRVWDLIFLADGTLLHGLLLVTGLCALAGLLASTLCTVYSMSMCVFRMYSEYWLLDLVVPIGCWDFFKSLNKRVLGVGLLALSPVCRYHHPFTLSAFCIKFVLPESVPDFHVDLPDRSPVKRKMTRHWEWGITCYLLVKTSMTETFDVLPDQGPVTF